jgi:hypothetical protein
MDWTAFATSQQHSALTMPRLHNNQASLARMLDPATVTYTGTTVTGAKRVNTSAAGGRFQMFNGTSWADQAINGLSFDGTTASFGSVPVAASSNVTVGAGTTDGGRLTLIGSAGFAGTGLSLFESSSGNSRRLRVFQDATQVTYNATFATGGNAHVFQIGNTDALTIDVSRNTTAAGTLTATALIPSAASAPSVGMYLAAAGTLGLSGGGVGQVFVTSTGVGVSTNAPSSGLDVNGFIWGGAKAANPGGGGNVRLRDDTATFRWLAGMLGSAGAVNYSIFDAVGGAERLQITPAGNVSPGADQAQNFGSGSLGWLSVFANSLVRSSAGDLQVSAANASGNVVLRANGIDALRVLATGASQFNRRAFTATATVAFAASLTIDATTSNYVEVGTLTGNVTTLTLNNPVGGHALTIRFVQDATGGRTVALPSGAKVNGTQQTGANRVAFLNLVYSTAAARWEGAWSEVPA